MGYIVYNVGLCCGVVCTRGVVLMCAVMWYVSCCVPLCRLALCCADLCCTVLLVLRCVALCCVECCGVVMC